MKMHDGENGMCQLELDLRIISPFFLRPRRLSLSILHLVLSFSLSLSLSYVVCARARACRVLDLFHASRSFVLVWGDIALSLSLSLPLSRYLSLSLSLSRR